MSTKSEVSKVRRKVLQLILEDNITEYADLVDILSDGCEIDDCEITEDMFDVATSEVLFFTSFLASRRRKSDVGNTEVRSTDAVQGDQVTAQEVYRWHPELKDYVLEDIIPATGFESE